MALDENASPVNIESVLWSLHSRIMNYTLKQIWRSILLLIPVKMGGQHILLAVSNARLATSQSAPARCVHEVLPGHSKPDRDPFAILFLNSAPFSKPRGCQKLMFLTRKYLGVIWRQLHGSELEFIDWVDVKVSPAPTQQPGTHIDFICGLRFQAKIPPPMECFMLSIMLKY